jgi:Domain of Unknown Function (DUF1080)
MQSFILSSFVLFVSFVVNIPAYAADTSGVMTPDQLRAAGFQPLIENDSLDAWHVKPGQKDHWILKDGVIDYDGKAGGKSFDDKSLWTKKPFGDLEFYCEWRLPAEPHMKPTPIVLYNGDFLMQEGDPTKRVTRPHLDAGDTGILFRGTSKCQANIWCQELGSGEINGYRTDKKMPQSTRRACIPIKNADHPLGEWNTFLVTINGNHMSVDTNGERVINEAELPDLPKTGPIGLQHHGDPAQFRQIWVKEL